MSTGKSGYAAACAAAAVVSCWGVGAGESQAATSGVLETSLANALDNAYLLYGLNFSFLSEGQAISLGTVGAGEQNFNVKLNPFELEDRHLIYWAVVGIYDGAEGVSVTMTPNAAMNSINDMDEFSDVFFGNTEAEIAAALTGGDTTTLLDFFSDNIFDMGMPFDFEGTQVDFSEATENGSAILTIPAPGAAALFLMSGLAAMRRRR